MRILVIALLVGLIAAAGADPCGMVPPISLDGDANVIERVGDQKTYVFRKGDLQTVVIHPGFQGNVDQFGMLIPFPTVPALRKMPDNVFEQLANAVEPPVIDYWVHRPMPKGAYRSAPSASGLSLETAAATEDRVVVLKEEAVGMYEVAVLEAGSAAALKRWMTDHDYQFPDGMESTCNDYVEDGWCFVAVKTRVGRKAGVDPKPGMRTTNPTKPKDSTFNGKVQAMGFRFRSDKFVVPMRLSAFNGGDLHNVIYVLAEEPVRAANLPQDFVQKQLDGEELYSHVQGLLPYQIRGGTEDDMSPNDWNTLKAQRDPAPYNGVAAQLFAHDLLAYESSELSHTFEEKEKLLLDIGEQLNLRGGRMDAFHSQVLAAERQRAQALAMESLKSMSFTVIEGDFPRDVIANENIRFEKYEMKPTAQVELKEDQATVFPVSVVPTAGMVSLGVLLTLGLGLLAWRKPGGSKALLATALLICVLPLAITAEGTTATAKDLIQDLDDPEQSVKARQHLKAKGEAAYPYLIAHLRNPDAPLVGRGYCLVLLNEANQPVLDDTLERLALDDPSQLLQLWAKAALVDRADSPAEILELFQSGSATLDSHKGQALIATPLPELQRPIALKLQDQKSEVSVEQLLRFLDLDAKLGTSAPQPYVRGGSAQHVPQSSPISPTIKLVITPELLAADSEQLNRLMFKSAYQEVRQNAAGLLAYRAQENPERILSLVIEELALGSGMSKVPWEGGALFIPQFAQLNKTQATELIGALVRWSVWAELHKAPDHQVKPVENNLRSYSLWSVAGGDDAGWRNANGAAAWLEAYRMIAGKPAARTILEEQLVSKDNDLWLVVR
jgi:uncharacterized protein DUF2330